MPNLYRTIDGVIRKPGVSGPFQLADGSFIEGVWTGSATEEKLDWWSRLPGHQIVQSELVAAVASKADDDGELIWDNAPKGVRIFFVLIPVEPGKNYRKAKLVTTEATQAQSAYFRHHRAALFGTLSPDGSLRRVPPLEPPPPAGPKQRELF
jgi:hypothetical protein